MRTLTAILSALLSLTACGSPEPTPEPTPTAAAAVVAAAPVVVAEPVAAAPTVAGLYEGWSATDPRIGTEITLAGTFGNAMSGDGHVSRVSVATNREDTRNVVWCELTPETAPESIRLMGYYSPITVRGTIADDHGRPALTGCAIVPEIVP